MAATSVVTPALDEWVRQSALPSARNLTGVTSTHGFASGEALTLIETFDGGATWSNVDLGSTSSDPLYNAYCLDGNTCFAIGNSATGGPDIYRTSNAGVTWQRITGFPLGGSWYHIDFVAPTVGFMGSNGATVRTTDAGVTWVKKFSQSANDVLWLNDTTAIAIVGTSIYRSTNSGDTCR